MTYDVTVNVRKLFLGRSPALLSWLKMWILLILSKLLSLLL